MINVNETKKEWETPVLIVRDVNADTEMDLAGSDDGGLYS